MNKNSKQINFIAVKKVKKDIFSLVFGISMLFSFGLSNICLGYVTPDWEAQIKANERQKPHSAQIVVNVKKELKNNKRQKADHRVKVNKKAQKKANKKQKIEKKVKVDKKAQKRNNKKQETKVKPYKYDRQAELKRNALQKVR
jgi:hypothetical protein